MNDRELLELAAKVAGVHGEYLLDIARDGAIRNGIYDSLYEVVWNPLYDDGDSLRLACLLMTFQPYKSLGYLPFITADAPATRRAIVRAAAEIGKGMK